MSSAGEAEPAEPTEPGARPRGARAWARWALLDAARARLRTPYRLVIHAVAVLLGYLLGAVLVWAGGESSAVRGGAVALQSACAILSTWFAARWLDRRAPLSLLGRWDRHGLVELAVGASLGAALIGLVAAVEVTIGGARYELAPPTASALPRAMAAIAFFSAVAIDEELWFRAYQLTNLAEGLEGWLGARAARGAALAISAVSFGLAHALNPNATPLATANIAVGGVFLGVSYAITGRLYVALGVHFAWNTAQCFLDMPVSGQILYDDLFVRRVETGDDLLTGGAFGPEGGVLGLLMMILGTVLCVIHARARVAPRGDKLDAPAGS